MKNRSGIRRCCSITLFALGSFLLVLSTRARIDGVGPLGSADINVITGTETSPNVTQNTSSIWSHGNTVVVVYTDGSGINLTPLSLSGVSTSTDGGATFTRLPERFNADGDSYGPPTVFYSLVAGKWFTTFLSAACGSSGVKQYTSLDGVSWASGSCVATSTDIDQPTTWVDNNPASPFYGRQYSAFNDFGVGGGAVRASYSTNNGTTWSTPVTVFTTFRRAVKIFGSRGADGTAFIETMDEGGGSFGLRRNFIHRSTDGGVTWSAPIAQGGASAPAGRTSCFDASYFSCMYGGSSGAWRHMGAGQPDAGPNGVLHYAYTGGGPTVDPGNIYYVRSTDNGSTWSAPIILNTDATTRAQWAASLAVNPQGYVVVSWNDERNTTNTVPGTGQPTIQRFARISIDNGATWGADMPLSDVIFPVPLQPQSGIGLSNSGFFDHAAFSQDGTGLVAFHAWTDGRVAINGAAQQDVFIDKVTFVLPVRLVTTTADHDDGVCDAADCTLREAITAANAVVDFDIIRFAPSVTGTIQLAGTLPAITTRGWIEGPGANLLTVRRNTAPEYRIFTIDHATFSISGLTISNGQLTAFGDIGAGIYNNGGTLTLTNCALTGHNGYAAGALSNQNDGSVAVSNCIFSGNTAFEGGAIDNAAISKNATLTVTNSTFSGNSASNNGGAIANGAIGASASLFLTNCTFSDNSSPAGGAVNNLAVSGGASSLTVRNTIFKTGLSGANLANSGGTIISHGHNLSNDAAGGSPAGTGPGGFLNGSGDKRNTNPLLGPLQDNGGPTATNGLLSGSPAIDMGDNALAPAFDQRGYIRPGISDIGAFESGGIVLRIISIVRSGNDIVITFNAVAGKTFRLERKDTLTDLDWLSIPGVVDLTPGTTGNAQFTHMNGSSSGHGFYRVRLLP